MRSVLLMGLPRGGTTWIGQVLGHTRGAVYVHEPDGTADPFAFRAKRHQFNQPVIDAGAPRSAAPELAALFDGALAGGAPSGTWRDRIARRAWKRVTADDKLAFRRTGRPGLALRVALAAAEPRVAVPGAAHAVVKTVNAAFCADWIVRHCEPAAVGVIARHPLNVLASWRAFGWTPPSGPQYRAMRARAGERWNVELPPPDAPPVERAAAVVGALGYALHDARRRHPDWVDIGHEDLCADAADRFPTVAGRLGLEWTDEAAAQLEASDRPGDGYATNRVTAEQPDRWRTRLDAGEARTAAAILERFPGAPWLTTLA